MRTRTDIVTAREMGLIACRVCGRVCQCQDEGRVGKCPRCGARMHRRKPNSVGRTWALLLSAMILYIPANVIPIMHTHTIFFTTDSTILHGVMQLWRAGSADLAVIVFCASIMVPLLKFLALGFLLLRSRRPASRKQRRQQSKLYRIVDIIGHWSMLDVFVVALLTGVIQLGQFANVAPRGAAIWFALVVVLTMLASMSYEPRLAWDHDDVEESA